MAISREQLVTLGGMTNMGMDYNPSGDLMHMGNRQAKLTIGSDVDRRLVSSVKPASDVLTQVQELLGSTGKQLLHIQGTQKEPERAIDVLFVDPRILFQPIGSDDPHSVNLPERAVIADDNKNIVVFDNQGTIRYSSNGFLREL